MPDHIDDLLNASIASLRAEITPRIKPDGTAAVRATVQHRHRVRVITVSSLAAVLVLGPAAAYAALGFDRDGTPPVTTTPDPTVRPTIPATSAPPLPDGRIPAEQLRSSTLDVPAFPGMAPAMCPNGKLAFVNGIYPKGGQLGDPGVLEIVKTVHARSAVGGSFVTATLIRCQFADGDGSTQVVAYNRDAAGGTMFVGVVVGSKVLDVAEEPAGGIRAEVYDRAACCGYAPEMKQKQWRTYGWNGSGFVQIDGPTAFPPNPFVTDLVVTASNLKFGPAQNKRRSGSMTVVVRNKGPFASPKQRVQLDGGVNWVPTRPVLVRADGATCHDDVQRPYCEHGVLASGAEYTIRLDFTLSDLKAEPWQVTVEVSSYISGDLEDLVRPDNRTTFTIDAS